MIRQAIQKILPKSSLGYELPERAFFDFLDQETKYTPDIAILEQHEWQLYFACDETQLGHHKGSLLGESVYKMPGFTQKPFNYWDPKVPFLPPIPMEAKGFRNPMPFYPEIAKIKGQVLLIRPQTFLKLDEYKEQGVQYRREKARIIVPYRKIRSLTDHPSLPTTDIEVELAAGLGLTFERVHVIRAWMYVGIPEYWDKLITAFDYGAVQTYESKSRLWCPTYYQYRRPPKPPA
jgi:hypothetical protein